jgi:hypothetical protein
MSYPVLVNGLSVNIEMVMLPGQELIYSRSTMQFLGIVVVRDLGILVTQVLQDSSTEKWLFSQ